MEQPIACSLSPAESEDRTGQLAALARHALCRREQAAAGERLVFAYSEDTERELLAAVAAEASCCAFLRMDLQRADDQLVLEIAGPPEARPIIATLFA